MERRRKGLAVSPPWVQPIRWSAVQSAFLYYHAICRIRSWGSLPRRRGPTLLIANHQHEFEASIVVGDVSMASLALEQPVFTISSRRMWEPGFFADRFPWTGALLRSLNAGALFEALGMQPIENELHSRPLNSIAHGLRAHGNVPVAEVFRENVTAKLGPRVSTVASILDPANFETGHLVVSLSSLHDVYRKELMAATRAQLEDDIAHFEQLAREGATIFIAPEGYYSGDGKMLRLRGILPRLAALAEVWLAGISYDMFAGRKLSLLYRVAKAEEGVPYDVQLKRIRPVTVSALLATWLLSGPQIFGEGDAIEAVVQAMASLPSTLFVDPELQRDPRRVVRAALTGMTELGTLRHGGAGYALAAKRTHPEFPRTADTIAYQANFHAETLEGARQERASA